MFCGGVSWNQINFQIQESIVGSYFMASFRKNVGKFLFNFIFVTIQNVMSADSGSSMDRNRFAKTTRAVKTLAETTTTRYLSSRPILSTVVAMTSGKRNISLFVRSNDDYSTFARSMATFHHSEYLRLFDDCFHIVSVPFRTRAFWIVLFSVRNSRHTQSTK